MVMELSTFVWHPGPYINLNTTLGYAAASVGKYQMHSNSHHEKRILHSKLRNSTKDLESEMLAKLLFSHRFPSQEMIHVNTGSLSDQ